MIDVDGTLLRLKPVPHGVKADRALLHVLDVLMRATGGAVALVSGRSLADLDRLFPALRLPMAGQHGAERRLAPGGNTVCASDAALLDDARGRLRTRVENHPRLLLEDKGQSLALHYRRVPRLAGYVHRLLRAELARLGHSHRLQRGHRVAELRPAGANKGSAVRAFLRESPFRGRLPVYLGDDRTDEDAFAVVNELGGHTIRVGAGASAARWRLPDVTAVRRWLAGAGREQRR
jgi:trehalose 6-phosphate phosphatase